jgi:hypothetical protein
MVVENESQHGAMTGIARTARNGAERLQAVAERSSGERARRAAAAAVVLRAVAAASAGAEGAVFLVARARGEVAKLPAGPERAVLRRMVELYEGGTEGVEVSPGRVLTGLLVAYAGEVERSGRLEEADAALELACEAAPRDPEAALHAGRIARKLGDAARARRRYAEVRALDAPCGRFARLASIGEALISAEPERALGRAIREAVRAGDAEAAAIGHEERAAVRRAAGDGSGAIRDLCAAMARFVDPVDRARVAHALADQAVAAGDALAAREALLLVLEQGDAVQQAHARSRLYTLSLALGDELGVRRWRDAWSSKLISLGLYRVGRSTATAAPTLARWRDRLERRLR